MKFGPLLPWEAFDIRVCDVRDGAVLDMGPDMTLDRIHVVNGAATLYYSRNDDAPRAHFTICGVPCTLERTAKGAG